MGLNDPIDNCDNEDEVIWKEQYFYKRDVNILQENKMFEHPKLANDQFNQQDAEYKYVCDRLWIELEESLNIDRLPE